MSCRHGNDAALCMETGCLYGRMKFLVKQQGRFWYFVLLEESGEAAYVSPVRYGSAEEAKAVVLKLKGTDHWTPIVTVPDSVFTRSRGAV